MHLILISSRPVMPAMTSAHAELQVVLNHAGPARACHTTRRCTASSVKQGSRGLPLVQATLDARPIEDHAPIWALLRLAARQVQHCLGPGSHVGQHLLLQLPPHQTITSRQNGQALSADCRRVIMLRTLRQNSTAFCGAAQTSMKSDSDSWHSYPCSRLRSGTACTPQLAPQTSCIPQLV